MMGFMLTSLKVVSMAVEFFASSRRSATRLRRRVIGTRFSERWPSCGAGAAAGAAAGALASAGAGAFARCFSTSSRVRRPPTPVPLMAAGSRLCSASRRRIAGLSASLFCSSREPADAAPEWTLSHRLSRCFLYLRCCLRAGGQDLARQDGGALVFQHCIQNAVR